MRNRQSGSWYVEGDLGQSIQNAREAGLGRKKIIHQLQTVTDTPENRIQAVVEAVDVGTVGEDSTTVPLSQPTSIEASPRPSRPRRLGVNDISYLSDREFARVLGLTLEQFDGNTVRPLANETVEVNLFWNRQHRTIGLRTVTSTGEMVGENHIRPLLEGNTTSEMTRAPSSLLVVTNGTFSDLAEQTAENNDIGLFDGGHLERWFRRALIPFDAVGSVLEEGENHDGPLDELVALPTPPDPRCGVNPLELEKVSEMKTEATDEKTGITRQELLERLRSLHDCLDRLPKTGDLQGMSSVYQNDYVEEFGSWDEALEAAGIDKEQALLDDIERVAERVGGVPSTVDMDEHGTYSADYYQSHFELWSTALERSGVEEDDDSGSDNNDVDSDNNDREAMLETIRTLYRRLGRVPNLDEILDECVYPQNRFYKQFGSLDEALGAAGIDKEQALLDEIQRIAEELGRVPNYAEMSEYGDYSGATYTNYFDSWSTALDQSGVRVDYESGPDNGDSGFDNGDSGSDNGDSGSDSNDREAMLETIRELHEQLEHVPKTTELPEKCEHSTQDFYPEFGSWDEALEAAGIDKEKALVDEIQRVAEEIGRVPSTVDMQEYGPNRSYSSYFGSWDEALKAAGIDKEQALVDEIQRIAEELGRVPNYAEMSEYGDYSGATYTNYFGSWSNVLEQSGVKESYNSGSDNPNQKSATSTDEAEITATEGSCNQDEIITEIAKVQRIVHREPTRDDFKTNANIPISAVDEQFDSWKTAVNAAMASEQKHGTSSEGTTTGTDSTDPTATETPRNYSGRTEKSRYTPEGVLDEIRRVAVKLGRTPLVSDMQEHANISIDTARETFDTWTRARKEAGVDEITEARLSELRESYNSGSRREISDVTSEESGDGALLPPDISVDEIDDHVAGVGPTSIYAIKKAGYKRLGELHDATPEEVTECKGIGRAKATKVIQFVTENVSEPRDDTSISVNDEQSSPGKKGELYADPDEDGDYQMFDDYLEEL